MLPIVFVAVSRATFPPSTGSRHSMRLPPGRATTSASWSFVSAPRMRGFAVQDAWAKCGGRHRDTRASASPGSLRLH